ncbi:Cysteine-rich domain containing protein [Aphelenchoides avenae]|nr:Cysteine-rich domain containing protein [Aphelenchus avenae]
MTHEGNTESLKISTESSGMSAESADTGMQGTSTETSEQAPQATEAPKDNLLTFQCSVCQLGPERCEFGELQPSKARYKEQVYYMKDPFVAPDIHKKDYQVQDFLIVGSNCALCQKHVCIDEECSFFYRQTYCVPCAKREKHMFPSKLLQGIPKKPDS